MKNIKLAITFTNLHIIHSNACDTCCNPQISCKKRKWTNNNHSGSYLGSDIGLYLDQKKKKLDEKQNQEKENKKVNKEEQPKEEKKEEKIKIIQIKETPLNSKNNKNKEKKQLKDNEKFDIKNYEDEIKNNCKDLDLYNLKKYKNKSNYKSTINTLKKLYKKLYDKKICIEKIKQLEKIILGTSTQNTINLTKKFINKHNICKFIHGFFIKYKEIDNNDHDQILKVFSENDPESTDTILDKLWERQYVKKPEDKNIGETYMHPIINALNIKKTTIQLNTGTLSMIKNYLFGTKIKQEDLVDCNATDYNNIFSKLGNSIYSEYWKVIDIDHIINIIDIIKNIKIPTGQDANLKKGKASFYTIYIIGVKELDPILTELKKYGFRTKTISYDKIYFSDYI